MKTQTIQPPTHCARCNAAFPIHPPGYFGGSGYAILPDSSRICYDCADTQQREELRDTSKPFGAYLSGDGKTITTWTGGKLMRVLSESAWRIFGSRHNIGSCVTAIDCHGTRWHGRGAGRGMCINLRASKAKGGAR